MIELRPYQTPHAEKLLSILKKNRAALDGSDTGTGKTFVAAYIAAALKKIPVVICPKAVITEWGEVLDLAGIVGYTISNYEQFKNYNLPVVTKTKLKRKQFQFNTTKNHLVIFDEVHNAKNFKTANSKLLIAAGCTESKILMLSATVADNPIQLEAVGAILGLFRSRAGFWDYCFARGVQREPFGPGVFFNATSENLEAVHRDLYDRKGARMRKAEIPGFPENQVIPRLIDLGTASETISDLYEQIQGVTDRIEQSEKNDESNALTERLRARQKIEAYRLPVMAEDIISELGEGRSVVVFVNFRDSGDFLFEKISKAKIEGLIITRIHGGQSVAERKKNKDLFQSNESRCILVQIMAGGVGISLHDIHGGHPRVSFLCPNDSPVLTIQAMGRIPRDGAKSPSTQYLYYIKGTIEEKVYKNVNSKIRRMEKINDGDYVIK